MLESIPIKLNKIHNASYSSSKAKEGVGVGQGEFSVSPVCLSGVNNKCSKNKLLDVRSTEFPLRRVLFSNQ